MKKSGLEKRKSHLASPFTVSTRTVVCAAPSAASALDVITGKLLLCKKRFPHHLKVKEVDGKVT